MGEGFGVLTRRTIAMAISATCLSGALAGCNDTDPDDPPDSGLPSKSETTSTSPATPTSEPTPTEASGPSAPELPTTATKHTKAGAIAFVRFYLELLNYAAHTGDVRPLRQHSTSDCEACRDDAQTWSDLYSSGGWAKGGVLALKTVRATAPARPEDVYVGVTVARSHGTYKATPDAKAKSVPADEADLDYYLVWVHHSWRMARGEIAR
jgi:hypothetical protein